jgi:hypothetical protein
MLCGFGFLSFLWHARHEHLCNDFASEFKLPFAEASAALQSLLASGFVVPAYSHVTGVRALAPTQTAAQAHTSSLPARLAVWRRQCSNVLQ